MRTTTRETKLFVIRPLTLSLVVLFGCHDDCVAPSVEDLTGGEGIVDVPLDMGPDVPDVIDLPTDAGPDALDVGEDLPPFDAADAPRESGDPDVAADPDVTGDPDVTADLDLASDPDIDAGPLPACSGMGITLSADPDGAVLGGTDVTLSVTVPGSPDDFEGAWFPGAAGSPDPTMFDTGLSVVVSSAGTTTYHVVVSMAGGGPVCATEITVEVTTGFLVFIHSSPAYPPNHAAGSEVTFYPRTSQQYPDERPPDFIALTCLLDFSDEPPTFLHDEIRRIEWVVLDGTGSLHAGPFVSTFEPGEYPACPACCDDPFTVEGDGVDCGENPSPGGGGCNLDDDFADIALSYTFDFTGQYFVEITIMDEKAGLAFTFGGGVVAD